jgi:hypothetical protein
MRLAILLLGLALLAVSALAPALEAFAPCPEQCVDEGPASECTTDQCCSCCVHLRLIESDHTAQAEPLSPSSRIRATSSHLPLAADPGEILHIPKPTLA